MSELARLLGAYFRPHAGRFGAAVAASALAAFFTVWIPLLAWPLVDRELAAAPEAAQRFAERFPLERLLGEVPLYALVVLAFLGKGLFSYLSQYLMSWVAERTVADLRADLGRALAHHSVGWYAEQSTGALVARVTSDTERVRGALSEKLYDLVREPMNLVALAAYLFWLDWRLASSALLLAPLVLVPIVRFGRRLRRASEQSQETVGELARRVSELARGIRLVQSANAQELEAERIRHAARRIFAANLRAVRVAALTPPLMELLAGIGVAAAFFYGRTRIAAGEMSQGQFLSFFLALFWLYAPAKRLSRVQAAFEQAIAAARRSYAVLDAPRDVVEAAAAVELPPVRGEVRFERVSFRYGERWVLRDLHLVLPHGAVTALVGRSGAGKTTVANLLLRFYDPSEGRVAIDGHDLREVTLRSLRRQIGVVAQDVVLLDDTLRANIAYGLDAVAPGEVEAAARAAHADGFIRELPHGYETRVGEAGVKLSAGQRQRIAIARALLKDPPLLVLDEATSALDAESEALVVSALANLMRGRTTLVIAHRLSTVRRADRIAVLEGGRLVEAGTHAELVTNRGGLYSRLVELQAAGEIV